MKSKVMSLDEPRTPRSSPASARNNAYKGSNARSNLSYSGQGRISAWVPVALGAVALFVVLRALSEEDKRSTTQRWLDTANRRVNKWWPDIRDTAEDYGSRASRYVPDYDSARDWLYDMLPSRRGLSNLFSSGSDWLPNTNISKRQLLANFDWSNPPRWLKNVDLSTQSKRRRFLRDLRRYSSRKRDSFMSSMGWS
jgi:hypothetical protein